ncbi:hypothetical protein [Pararhizobium haloflavum]|uniref:hypothetical protein n=1 Tax=Pararhizobium haloflavum TaxID=2037914 RepID=UPI000C197173|nr:hypothetical protein [Pararhizobium haloflavum]
MTRRRSPLTANADFATLAFTAPFVIATRMTGMWFNAFSPSAHGDRENSRMVSEKLLAGYESLAAVNTSLATQMVNAAFAPWSGGRAKAFDTDAIVAASIRPFAKRVKSNARRLSRKT